MNASRSEQIGLVLESVVGLSRSLANPRSTPFGDVVLTRTQVDVLFVLAHSSAPVTPGALASALRMTPGAITQTVDQLREHQLVEHSVSTEDGRVRVLELTADARSQVADFEAGVVARVAPRFDSLADGELAELTRLLAKVSPH